MTTPDKNIVNLDAYELGDEKTLVTCTALWCGPCTRIKPVIKEMFGESKLSKEVQKDWYKMSINNLVPYFIITESFESFDKYKVISSIQTSDSSKFKEFVDSHKMKINIDDDF